MSDDQAKYEALRDLLGAAGGGKPVEISDVLGTVCRAVGLAGCALVIAPYEERPVALAGEEWAREALERYAAGLWRQLAGDHRLESAFMQLSPGDRPQSLFAYPLRAPSGVVGAVLGLAEGRRNLAVEEDFLLALATALHWARLAQSGRPEPGEETVTDQIEKARQAAILETAIAVNHEVNNPLTAVLGNTQLLLLQSEALDAQTRKRLQDIEKSALRIKDVTQRLLKFGPHRTTEYPGGLRMLDLSDPDKTSG